jgi:hypothetical protein
MFKIIHTIPRPQIHDGLPPLGANLSAVAPLQPNNLIRYLEIAVRTCLRTPYEGSFTLPYKDPVRSGPDTSLPRTRRSAVVLFVGPQLDRFASVSYTRVPTKLSPGPG